MAPSALVTTVTWVYVSSTPGFEKGVIGDVVDGIRY
jgi:hypothetical protein